MVKTVEGTPDQIAAAIAGVFASLKAGEIPSDQPARAVLILETLREHVADYPSDAEFARLMDEADLDAAAVGHVDDSREAIYTRMPGEYFA